MITTHTQQNESIKTKLASSYPWIIWTLASIFLFYKYLLQVSPSIMVDELMMRYNLNAEQLGHLAACYFYAYMVMQLPGGVLLDSIRLRILLPIAIAFCALGGLIFAVAPSFSMAQIGRIMIGLGGAFSATGTMKLISIWFPASRFAYASGLMMTFGMLGAVGGQAPLAFSMAHWGAEKTLIMCALIGFCLSALMFFLLREKKRDETSSKLTFKDLNVYLKRLLSNPQCWLISIFSGLAFAPISAFAGLWGVPFLVTKVGLSTTAAAMKISLVFVGFACGAPLSGSLSEAMGRRKPLMCWGTLLGCGMLSTVIYAPMYSPLALDLLLFGFGFFTSFFFISFAMIREINPVIMGGCAIGFINTFDAIFGSISEPLVGFLLDMGWQGQLLEGKRWFELISYQQALSLLPLAMIFSLILALFIKETNCRSKL